MSTANSPSDKVNEGTLAAQARAMFSQGQQDHVGVVTHFEAVELPRVVENIRRLVVSRGLTYRDALEETGGRLTYNTIAQTEDGMHLWIVGEQRVGVGVLLEAKIFHKTDESAQADEYLAEFVRQLNERITGTN